MFKNGDIVRIKEAHRNPGEKDLLYRVVNVNEVTRRCYIELAECSLPFSPQELVAFEMLHLFRAAPSKVNLKDGGVLEDETGIEYVKDPASGYFTSSATGEIYTVFRTDNIDGRPVEIEPLHQYVEGIERIINAEHCTRARAEEIYSASFRYWTECNATENLDLIITCKANTSWLDADNILRAVRKGEIMPEAAVCIARAERVLNDFVDKDYDEHYDEYEGNLPIWGDDWEYITDVLIQKAMDGMSGESILTAIKQWVEKGAYHFCYFETALAENKASLSAQIQSAVDRTGNAKLSEKTHAAEQVI